MDQKQATQQFVEIENVKDGIAILKSGALRQILMVTGVNFDLKSEEEQNLIIGGYQQFINSLDFSIEFVIHSRRLNINSYLDKLSEHMVRETNELLKAQIQDYIEFIRSYVETNAIMDKTFFAVVPYDPITLIPTRSRGGGIFSFLGKKVSPAAGMGSAAGGEKTAQPEDPNLGANIQQLTQRVDQVIVGLTQIGLRAVPLNTEEVIELFYNLYNPETVEKKGMVLPNEQ